MSFHGGDIKNVPSYAVSNLPKGVTELSMRINYTVDDHNINIARGE